jgi:hypothetical protein
LPDGGFLEGNNAAQFSAGEKDISSSGRARANNWATKQFATIFGQQMNLLPRSAHLRK